MFGFSLVKLLVLAAIVAAVWYGFKWVGRYQQVQRAKTAEEKSRIEGEDMVACSRCGTYIVPDRAKACGRADCPYPG
jgi:uncharacterized protein